MNDLTIKSIWMPALAATVLAVIAGLLFCIPVSAELLQFERSAVMAGQWWRLGSSHWVHWTANHLFWDVLTFSVLFFRAAQISWKRLFVLMVVAGLLIPGLIFWFHPEYITYRGLSGLDSALFSFVVLSLALKAKDSGERYSVWGLGALFGLFVAKVAYEYASGETLFVQSMGPGVVAVPLAHLVGGVLGALVALPAFGAGSRGNKSLFLLDSRGRV